MAKHTPGPWEYGTNPSWSPDDEWAISREVVVRPAGEFPHGRWIADCGLATSAEQLANARLIAAAPDLLEACEAAEPLFIRDGGTIGGQAWGKIRAALAKARGEQP